jgi:hypothetical protein
MVPFRQCHPHAYDKHQSITLTIFVVRKNGAKNGVEEVIESFLWKIVCDRRIQALLRTCRAEFGCLEGFAISWNRLWSAEAAVSSTETAILEDRE